MTDTQELTLNTIVGPRKIKAPAGWEFDKTGVKAWATLLDLTREGFQPHKTLRDKRVLEGQVHVIANLLANSIGMAAYYWETNAFDLVTAERRARD